MDILSDNDARTHEDCILAMRKKGEDIEANQNSYHVFSRVAGNKMSENMKVARKNLCCYTYLNAVGCHHTGAEEEVPCTQPSNEKSQ